MKKMFFAVLVLCFSVSLAHAMPDAPPLIKGDKVIVLKDGKETPLEEKVTPIADTDVSVVGLNSNTSDAGFYFYKKGEEKPYAFVEEKNAYIFEGKYSLSPDKKTIFFAMPDSGELLFFSLADAKSLGKIPYNALAPAPQWAQKGDIFGVLLTQNQNIGGDTYKIRQCQYDPCVATTAAFYEAQNKNTHILMQGSATCNYSVLGFENGEVSIGQLCLPNATDWKQYPSQDPTEVKKAL